MRETIAGRGLRESRGDRPHSQRSRLKTLQWRSGRAIAPIEVKI
ncbi:MULTISPECIES: hypothetical protein [Microcoleaceae]|nr:hypothetical protein [Lyngbya sp. CCAP 1446/10]